MSGSNVSKKVVSKIIDEIETAYVFRDRNLDLGNSQNKGKYIAIRQEVVVSVYAIMNRIDKAIRAKLKNIDKAIDIRRQIVLLCTMKRMEHYENVQLVELADQIIELIKKNEKVFRDEERKEER